MHKDSLSLAQQLISRRSLTPDDSGCQEILIGRLKKIGFNIERIQCNGVENLWARRVRLHQFYVLRAIQM